LVVEKTKIIRLFVAQANESGFIIDHLLK